jgi:hypothetical protein
MFWVGGSLRDGEITHSHYLDKGQKNIILKKEGDDFFLRFSEEGVNEKVAHPSRGNRFPIPRNALRRQEKLL